MCENVHCTEPAYRRKPRIGRKVLLFGELVLQKAELVQLFRELVKAARRTGSRKCEASSTYLGTGFTFCEVGSAFSGTISGGEWNWFGSARYRVLLFAELVPKKVKRVHEKVELVRQI